VSFSIGQVSFSIGEVSQAAVSFSIGQVSFSIGQVSFSIGGVAQAALRCGIRRCCGAELLCHCFCCIFFLFNAAAQKILGLVKKNSA
jgi:hypothetical protein